MLCAAQDALVENAVGGEAALVILYRERSDALGSNAALGGDAAHDVMVEKAEGSDAALQSESNSIEIKSSESRLQLDAAPLPVTLVAGRSSSLGKFHVQLGLGHGNHTHG